MFARIRSDPERMMAAGRWLLSAALTVMLAAIAFQLYAAISPGHKGDGIYAGTQVRATSSHGVDVDALANHHLFGLAPAPASSAAPISLDSSIQVIGVISPEPPQAGWAILAVNGEQQAYGAGQTLPDGERLVAVQVDRVVLEKAGNRYSLPLIMQEADPNARFRTVDVGPDAIAQVSMADNPNPAAAVPQRALPPTQQALRDLRQELLARPQLKLSRKSSPPAPTEPDPDL